jgi:hypothetical protein
MLMLCLQSQSFQICHFQVAALEKQVKERAKRDSQKDQAESEAPILNPGLNQLLLTQGGYVS